jgi:hypothetical protein
VKVTYELDETKTHYLNVDLDVWSRSRLEPLAEALGPRVAVLYVGGEGNRHEAHFELRGGPLDADASDTIFGLVRAIERLPPRAQRVWAQASVREFNVGVQAAAEPHSYEVRLSLKAVNAAARVGAGIVLTVYAPQPVAAAAVPPVTKRRTIDRQRR